MGKRICLSRKDRLVVLERDGRRCRLCGVATPREHLGTVFPDAPEVDHVVPWSCGGTNELENLRCLCRTCNEIKSDKLDHQIDYRPHVPGVVNAVEIFEANARLCAGAHNGGIKGGPIGGRRLHDLHPERARELGLKYGSKAGCRTHELHPEFAREWSRRMYELHPEHASELGLKYGSKGGSIGGRSRSPKKLTAVRQNWFKGSHLRWHVRRPVVNPNCRLCAEAWVARRGDLVRLYEIAGTR